MRADSYLTEHNAQLAARINHYESMNRYEAMLEAVKEALSSFPTAGVFLYQGALASYYLNQYEEALSYLEEAERNGYITDMTCNLQGNIFSIKEKYKRAEEAYLEALRLAPMNATLYANYAKLLYKLGCLDKARSLMEEAGRLDPNHPDVLSYRINASIARRDSSELAFNLQHFVERSSSDTAIYAQIGLSEYYQRHYGKAKKQFIEAVRRDPANNYYTKMLRLIHYEGHFMYVPIRWMDKVGGPSFFLLISFTLMMIGNMMDWPWQKQLYTGFWVIFGYLIVAKLIALLALPYNEDVYSKKSYQLENLFLVALAGGVLPMAWLGTRNGRWLNISPFIWGSLLGLSGIIFACKAAMLGLGWNPFKGLFYVIKLAEIALFGAYYMAYRTRYLPMKMKPGLFQPLRIDAAITCIFAWALEILITS